MKLAVDSSIAIAAFGEWHELNDWARSILDRGVAIPAHAVLETYSVLTGFPPPHRAPADVVEQWLIARFDRILPSPTPGEHLDLVSDLASVGRIGASIYDALIASCARAANCTLVTADRRAILVYEAIGVEILLPPEGA